MIEANALLSSALATYGFDHSVYQGAVSVSSYQCLKNNGKQFAILQAQQSNGSINQYAYTQYTNAKAAGIQYIDWYIFPTINQSASGQVTNTINYLKNNGLLNTNMIWIDVESSDLFYSSCSSNVNFLHEIFNTARSLYNGCGNNNCIGMYTSASQWNPICCGDTSFSQYQLWWPRYDGSASSANWSAFGGWSWFNIKQYQGTTSICSTEIDYDYY